MVKSLDLPYVQYAVWQIKNIEGSRKLDGNSTDFQYVHTALRKPGEVDKRYFW